MKKITFMVTLILTSLSIIACRPKDEASQSSVANSSTVAETTSETTTESTKETIKIDYALYNSVIEKYAKLTKETRQVDDEINSKALLRYHEPEIYPNLQYSLYDFDGNGVDELVIALTTKTGKHDILDIRTVKDNQVIKLSNANNKLAFIGERAPLLPLKDGYFELISRVSVDKHVYKLYRINQEGTDIEWIAEAPNEAGLGVSIEEIELTNWNNLTVPIGMESTINNEQTGMDITAIQKGDFSSVVGTWRNSDGWELTFDESGLVDKNFYVPIDHLQVKDNFLKAGLMPKKPGGAVALAFIPAGVSLTPAITSSPNNGYVDPSDLSKDRLWSGYQVIDGNLQGFFYRVQ